MESRTPYTNSLRSEKSQKLPDSRFGWLKPFRTIPDEYVLNHQSLDGYLYLRFIKMLALICFAGACVTWPILFPVNATGGGGQMQLDILSFANISKASKNRYYAHTFVAWVFLSKSTSKSGRRMLTKKAFVMYIITRETVYFINLRHAYLLAPFNASRISSRTVLFTDVPTEYLNIEKLRSVFGASMSQAWLTTNTKALEKDVENRDKAAMKLEGAEIKLSQKAIKKRMKAEKKGGKPPARDVADEEAGAVSSPWLDKKDRPTHRLGKIPLIGKKVDSIDWSRTELKELIPKVEKDQASHQGFKETLVPAVFVEFTTQQAAEAAYRRMTPRKSPHMNPRAVAVTPNEVIWKNLRIKRTERMGRKAATTTFITLMIIFWAIPVAVVGAISNINYLTNSKSSDTELGSVANITKRYIS